MNRFRLNRGEARRLWMLPLLLPYLFFSVAIDGLHNHPLLPGCTPSSLHTARAVASPSPGINDASQTDQDNDDCIACQWNSMASAMVSLCAVLAVPSHHSAEVTASVPSAVSTADFIRAGRGPPSL